MEKSNSTYYSRVKNASYSPRDTKHLDHLFDTNNNYVDDTYAKQYSETSTHRTNYNYDQNESPLNNSINMSPLSDRSSESLRVQNTSHQTFASPSSYTNRTSYSSLTQRYTKDEDDYFDKCLNNLVRKINTLQNSKQNLSDQCNSVFKDAEIAKKRVSEAAEQLHNMIEEDKERLHNEANQYVVNSTNELEKIRAELEKNLKTTEDLLTYVKDLKTSCEPEEVPNHVSSINEMLKEVNKFNQNVTVGALKYKPSKISKNNLLGEVSVSDLDTSDPYLEEPVRFGVIEGSRTVAGITVSQDKIYIIRELLPNVEIYNGDLTRYKMLKLEGLRKPSDIAADSISNHIYISDASGCVFKLNPETNELNKLAIDVSSDPQGLFVIPRGADDAGNILITCSDSKQIKEYSSQGDFVKSIKLQHEMASPWHCALADLGSQNADGRRFVISHGYESGKAHRVCYVSEKGLTLNSFGKSNGSGNAKLDIPNRISIDKFGYVFVADRNNDRVVLLSPNLIYVRDVISKFQKIKQPRRLYLDQGNGWLFVGLIDGTVHIFQLCDEDYNTN